MGRFLFLIWSLFRSLKCRRLFSFWWLGWKTGLLDRLRPTLKVPGLIPSFKLLWRGNKGIVLFILRWGLLIWLGLKSSRFLLTWLLPKKTQEYRSWQVLMVVFHVWVIAYQLWLINQELTFLLETQSWQEFWVILFWAKEKWGSSYALVLQCQLQLKLFQLCNLRTEQKGLFSTEVIAKVLQCRKRSLRLRRSSQLWKDSLKNRENWGWQHRNRCNNWKNKMKCWKFKIQR